MSINAMHAKSGLRVVLKWKIYRPDSVIANVIPLNIMKIPKQFGIGVLLVVVSVTAGFLSGRQHGYNHRFANWKSLPIEHASYSTERIINSDANPRQAISRLIADIREHLNSSVPAFRGTNLGFSISETPESVRFGITVKGNVVVQTEVERYLREIETAMLLQTANGKLTESDIKRYQWARASYFEMKKLVGE